MHPSRSTSNPIPSPDDLPPMSAMNEQDSSRATPLLAGALPATIGPYKILGLLGSGGMGVVYRAQQEQPRRQVALKMMMPGTATPERLRRFEFEAQALGRLEHLGIARIYQTGTADTGQGPQPYFAMELVRGRPLITYADENRLGVKGRLRLMIQVCRAMQYAHHYGVIHRDLKPGNILVDSAGQPRVLDFGVARVTDADLAASTLQTDEGQLVGTLPYMSPEQAAADPREIDWRTDVYSLGVLCFELVSGRLPRKLSGKGVLAAVRALTEEEPARLSSVSKAFRGDLDTIVAKALERDKTRRYQSASDLAEDLECFLDDRPIKARPAGAVYQLGKFARRHKALVAGVLVVLLVLVGATVLSARYALQARRAEQTTRDALADTYEQAARLAMQRGAWRNAIDLIDKALASDRYHGSGPLRLNKVRALMAMQNAERAEAEIAALAGEPNLGEHEGSVLLLQGDLLLGRDVGRAEQIIAQALAKGLPSGEAAYAKGLLARTMPEAVDHLRRALRHDRYQPRARAVLELLLVLMGRLREARIELAAHEALFPDDPNYRLIRVRLAALEGERKETNEELAGLQDDLDAERMAQLRADIQRLAQWSDHATRFHPDTGLPDVQHHAMEVLAGALPRLWEVPPRFRRALLTATEALKGKGLETATVYSTIWTWGSPRLSVAHCSLAMWIAMDAGFPAVLADLDQAVAVNPEGTLRYARACTLFAAARYAEAEKAALDAARAPALFPVRRQCLLIAAACQGMLYDRKPDPALRTRIIASLREMLFAEPTHVCYQPPMAVSLALQVEDDNLVELLLDDWQRHEPGNALVPRIRAMLRQKAAARLRAEQEKEKEKKTPAKRGP